jgi:hypothetical protein
MTIHHVNMDDRAAAALGRGNLVCQVRKVRREYGWKKLNHGVFRDISCCVSVSRRGLGRLNAPRGQIP